MTRFTENIIWKVCELITVARNRKTNILETLPYWPTNKLQDSKSNVNCKLYHYIYMFELWPMMIGYL